MREFKTIFKRFVCFRENLKPIFKNLYQFIILILVKTSVSNAKSHHKEESVLFQIEEHKLFDHLYAFTVGQYVLIFTKGMQRRTWNIHHLLIIYDGDV